MNLCAPIRSLGALMVLAALGCLPAPQEKEDPVAETLRMLEEGERTVRSSGGSSQNVLVRVERVAASGEDGARLAALWRYADGRLVVSGRDGLSSGGVRLGVAGERFAAELSAQSARAGSLEKTSAEIVVQAGGDGVLWVTRSALVPVLRLTTSSGEATVLRDAQLGAQLAVRPRFVDGGAIELELHPVFASVNGSKGAESYSLDALSTRVVLSPGQKLILGANASAAQDSAAMGLFGYSQRGERRACIVSVTVERL